MLLIESENKWYIEKSTCSMNKLGLTLQQMLLFGEIEVLNFCNRSQTAWQKTIIIEVMPKK